MVRIVICAAERSEGLHLRHIVDAYATSRGFYNVDVLVMNSREEFASLLSLLKPNFFDMALCQMDGRCSDMSLDEIYRTASGVRAIAPKTRFVFMSSDKRLANCAYKAEGRFLQLPLEQEDFERVVGKAIDEVFLSHRNIFAVKSGKTVVNVNLDDVSFVEAGKKGPVIHLPVSSVLVTRSTLQLLYDRLEQASDSFMKVGGSFIVNLENMRTAGESTAIFGDGETIILPTRLRKPVRDALRAYRVRAS